MWRTIIERKNISESRLTLHQNSLLQFDDTNIRDMYRMVHDLISEIKTRVIETIVTRLETSVAACDTCQKKPLPGIRSLAALKLQGTTITMDRSRKDQLCQNADEHISLLDFYKDKRWLYMNGFPDSKISFLIHDMFDHFWFFDLLERHGMFSKYNELMSILANPAQHDVSSREGELLASIAFNFRVALNDDGIHQPLMMPQRIKNILESSIQSSPNQLHARKIFDDFQSDHVLMRLISIIASGVLLETLELYRKYGFPKDFSTSYAPQIIPPHNPEYIAFIVEACRILFDNKTQALQALTNTMLLAEDYLRSPASLSSKTITLSDIQTNPLTPHVPEDTKIWLQKHLGALALTNIVST